jgi:hypothetical protein
MLINSPNISGSLKVTGNTVITGSLTVLGGINATITGSATSASYVEYSNVANKPTLVSGSAQVSFNGITDKPTLVSGSAQVSFNGITDKPTLVSGSSQITYSGLSGIPSGIVSGSAQVSFNGIVDKPTLVSGSSQITYSGISSIPAGIVSSSAQIGGYGIFATTGSNQFNGSQAVTGSLTVTGQVVAQTLNVQQVTSSIVYSSGSNIFGNTLGNTQQFTGSVSVTGSFVITTTGTEFQVASTGVNLGNALTDSHIISGSLRVNPNGLFVSGSGNVGIGTTSPTGKLMIEATGNHLFLRASSATAGKYWNFDVTSANQLYVLNNAGTQYFTMTDTGNFGIGATSPGVRLVNSGATLASVPTLGSGTIGANAILSANGLYGLYTGVASEGWVWQQVQRNDSNSDVYSLVLQPSGGNVGIGTTSITNGTTFGGGGQINRLKVQSTNYTCLEINGSTSGGSVQFTYGTNSPNQVAGIIGYNYANGAANEFAISNVLTGSMIFATSNTERTRITSDGYLRMSANSNGIQFNGDTAAANALDDYEEGTWTPAITGLTLNVTRATYVKIGSLVQVLCVVYPLSGTGSGNVMTGLPFAANSGHRSGVSFGNVNGINWGAGATAPFGFAYSTSIAFYGFANNAPYTTADFSTFGSGDFLEFSAVYHLN